MYEKLQMTRHAFFVLFCFVFVEHDITFNVSICLSLFLRAFIMAHYITFIGLMVH